MTEINPSPKTTPIKVTKERAVMAPTKTDKGRPVLEVMRIAANWVLSPNSARKMVPIVVRKIFQSIFFLLSYSGIINQEKNHLIFGAFLDIRLKAFCGSFGSHGTPSGTSHFLIKPMRQSINATNG